MTDIDPPEELRPALRAPGVARADPLFRHAPDVVPAGLATTRQRLDGYRCACCGFTCDRYMMIWQRGASPRALDDLRTVCRFCWQVMNLETADALRSAALIWLPEIPQRELNRRMPDFYAARPLQRHAGARIAQRLAEVFKARMALADAQTGLKGLAGLAGRLSALAPDDPEARRLLGLFDTGLRLLPLDRWIAREGTRDYNQFPQILAYWRSRRGPLADAADSFPLVGQDWLRRLGARIEAPASG